MRPTIYTSSPSLAAATAWFAPLPPGVVKNDSPSTVSPLLGTRFVETTKSIDKLPTT